MTTYKSYLGKNNLPKDFPRGLRNNNPGNLIKTSEPWNGKVPHSKNTDSRFEQFIELRYGIRAKMRDLITDINKGKNTIAKIIAEFAPDIENDTNSYINSVAKMVGLGMNTPIKTISEDLLIALCKAISFVENKGNKFSDYTTDQDYQDALDILGKTVIPVQKKKVVQSCPCCLRPL